MNRDRSVLYLSAVIIVFAVAIFLKLNYFQKQLDFPDVVFNEKLSSQSLECGAEENVIVTKIIDGDTIIVDGGHHVRLLGIDADEKGYPCYDEVKIRLEELILGNRVRLEKDKTDTDRYGRCLRNVFIRNDNIVPMLIGEGLAVARFYEPDTKYKNEITMAEKQAIENNIGCKWRNK